jgi:hypothetical protein
VNLDTSAQLLQNFANAVEGNVCLFALENNNNVRVGSNFLRVADRLASLM